MGNGFPCGFPFGNEDGISVMLMKEFKSKYNPKIKHQTVQFRDNFCTFTIKDRYQLLLEVEIRDFSKCKETYVKLDIPRIGPKSDIECITLDHNFSCKCKVKKTNCDCRIVKFKPSDDEIKMNYDNDIEKYICWGCLDLMEKLKKDSSISEKFVKCYNNKRNTTLTRDHIYKRFKRCRRPLFVDLKNTKIHVDHDNHNDIIIIFKFVIYDKEELDNYWRNISIV